MSTNNKIILNYLIPIGLIGLLIYVPKIDIHFDINAILTITSLIFAILIGFFIATTTNYLKLQTLITGEDSTLISIYNLIKIIQPSRVSELKEKIDNYATRTLDYSIKEYIQSTNNEFKDLLRVIDEVLSSNTIDAGLKQTLFDRKDALIRGRQETNLASQTIVMPSHWIILILLSVLIFGLILSIKDNSSIFLIVSGMLSLSIYFTLILLYKIDSNIFLEEQLAFQNSQIIFAELDTLRYFPYLARNNPKIKTVTETYRLGFYKDGANKNLSSREIVLINKK